MAFGEVHNVCVNLTNGTLAVGTSNVVAFFVPTDAVGGGITVTKVGYASNDAIAAASAPVFTCVSLGTNSAINGTIATSTGSVAWTAGTLKAGTLSTTFIDAGYGVAFTRIQTAVNGDIPVVTGFVQYLMGR